MFQVFCVRRLRRPLRVLYTCVYVLQSAFASMQDVLEVNSFFESVSELQTAN